VQRIGTIRLSRKYLLIDSLRAREIASIVKVHPRGNRLLQPIVVCHAGPGTQL
jgi:hypothetical protein